MQKKIGLIFLILALIAGIAWAAWQDEGELTTPAGGDDLLVRDISDPTDHATAGTVKRITFDNLIPFLLQLIGNGEKVRLASTTDGHAWSIQAYDVDGAAWADVLTFTNANTPAVTLGSAAELQGLGTINLDAATDYKWGGNALLDDTKGNGDSGYIWSADKIYDELAAAKKVNNLGSFTSPITTNPYSLTAANSYNVVLWYGATGEVDLPAGVQGMNLVIYNTGAYTITIDPNGTDVIVRDGTAQSAGVSFTLSSGAGNYVALDCDANNHWVTLGYKGTLAEGS